MHLAFFWLRWLSSSSRDGWMGRSKAKEARLHVRGPGSPALTKSVGGIVESGPRLQELSTAPPGALQSLGEGRFPCDDFRADPTRHVAKRPTEATESRM